MSDVVVDLLARLSEEARRGAGGEVVSHPAPRTRGTGTVAGPADVAQADRCALLARLSSGGYSDMDVAIARELTRSPFVYSEPSACVDGCRYAGRPVRLCGVIVAESVCEQDGVCWTVERETIARLRAECRHLPPRERDAFMRARRRYRPTITPTVVIVEAEELPIVKLAKRKIGQPPKMTAKQIQAALEQLNGGARITDVARAGWREWGFKTERSAEHALRRYRRQRDNGQLEVAA